MVRIPNGMDSSSFFSLFFQRLMLAIYSSGVSVDHNRGFFTVMVKGISCLFPDVIFTVLLVVDTTFPLGEVRLIFTVYSPSSVSPLTMVVFSMTTACSLSMLLVLMKVPQSSI